MAEPGAATTPPGRLTLLFDADDTLWENNVHFERAIEAWLVVVTGPACTEAEARAELDRFEEAAFVTGAVGTAAFGRHLRLASEALVEPQRLADVLAAVDAIVRAMPSREVTLLPGVAETLEVLGSRHELGIVTRGDPAEQWAKIDASGLRDRFAHAAVVPHKTPETYRELVARWGLDAGATWMIGNSPRSDILPARAAGLRAVFISHPSTWRLEHEELDPHDGGVISVERFGDLLALF